LIEPLKQEIAVNHREIRVNDPQEALIVEQALAMYREMRCTAKAAPDGQVLSQVEQLAVVRGREFTRKSLEAILNEEAQEVEKKGRVAGPAAAADRGITADGKSDRSSRRPAR
jgi:hypothetical protein